MDDPHRLRTLLQLQLATDSSAALHLPYVLESISPEDFLPSSHTQKWTTRISSLIHSKDPAARWSGLCLALQTAIFSKDLMMECAQGWIGVALPLLSRDDALPTLKASIRLLRHIFSSATDAAEFQRQLCIPNVPKFTASLTLLADKQHEVEIKLLAMATLTHLIPLYPNLHRGSHASLVTLSLKFLNGSTPKPTPVALVEAASQLYSVLHVTGGKVGAANLWRKSVDETLAFAWGAFINMRRTSPLTEHSPFMPQPAPSAKDPLVLIPLSLDRLRAAARVLCDLLRVWTSRPVFLPVGPLVQLCLALLRCTPEEKAEGHVDTTLRAMEVSVIPAIWILACDLLVVLSDSAHCHLTPHLPQLISHLSYHLEQVRPPAQRLCFLKATSSLLSSCPHLHDIVLSSRIARAILPFLIVVLATKSEAQTDAGVVGSRSKSKRAKKRARGYEGDEVFKVTMEIVCPTAEEGEVVLGAANAIQLVMRNTHLSPAVRSVVSRTLLSIYVTLPQMQPALISPDLSLYGKLYVKIRDICTEFALGTSSTMSKSLGLVIGTMTADHRDPCGASVLRDLDLLLHPRVPPLVRSLPHVETLSLFREEEGEEELSTRKSLGLANVDDTYSGVSPTEESDTLTPPALASTPRDAVQVTSSRTVEPVYSPRPHTVLPHRQVEPLTSSATAGTSEHFGVSQSTSTIPLIHASPSVSNAKIGGAPSVQQRLDSPKPQKSSVSSKASSTKQVPTGTALPDPPIGESPSIPTTTSIVQGPTPMDEDEEQEPMPTIDMDSDSDG